MTHSSSQSSGASFGVVKNASQLRNTSHNHDFPSVQQEVTVEYIIRIVLSCALAGKWHRSFFYAPVDEESTPTRVFQVCRNMKDLKEIAKLHTLHVLEMPRPVH